MAAPDVITPYGDLDELLVELLGHWQLILGENLFGAYIQGSFALGSGDQQSDCDWLVATRGVDIDSVDWGQRYLVATACRTLYTFVEARVASKTGALEWALRMLEPRWRPLLGQVRDERSLGWDPNRPPRSGETDAARAFVDYALGTMIDA